MLDWFDYHGHICIVFDKLGLNVYEFLVRDMEVAVSLLCTCVYVCMCVHRQDEGYEHFHI